MKTIKKQIQAVLQFQKFSYFFIQFLFRAGVLEFLRMMLQRYNTRLHLKYITEHSFYSFIGIILESEVLRVWKIRCFVGRFTKWRFP